MSAFQSGFVSEFLSQRWGEPLNRGTALSGTRVRAPSRPIKQRALSQNTNLLVISKSRDSLAFNRLVSFSISHEFPRYWYCFSILFSSLSLVAHFHFWNLSSGFKTVIYSSFPAFFPSGFNNKNHSAAGQYREHHSLGVPAWHLHPDVTHHRYYCQLEIKKHSTA